MLLMFHYSYSCIVKTYIMLQGNFTPLILKFHTFGIWHRSVFLLSFLIASYSYTQNEKQISINGSLLSLLN